MDALSIRGLFLPGLRSAEYLQALW